MSKDSLLNIYKRVLRPSAEYSNIIYHSLIPDYVSDQLESVQKQAIKIIFGHDAKYDEMVENGIIETLKSRRADAVLKFALKASTSERFGSCWFREAAINDREVRPSTRRPYIEKFCRTERSRNNPLAFMTRVLNEHLCTN